MSTYLVSVLPERTSAATRQIEASFSAGGPSLEYCVFREGELQAASCYVLRSESTGSRTLVNYGNAPDIKLDEFAQIIAAFETSEETWWHFEGRTPPTTLLFIRRLRMQLCGRVRISVEIERPGREGMEWLAAEADVVFYSRIWAEVRFSLHGIEETRNVDHRVIGRVEDTHLRKHVSETNHAREREFPLPAGVWCVSDRCQQILGLVYLGCRGRDGNVGRGRADSLSRSRGG